MIVLGIETSCDETSLALVNDQRTILAMATWSQIDEHRPYGGVVPEIAARAHIEKISSLLGEVFRTAAIAPSSIDAVAATAGPGLIGGLIVGTVLGKSLSLALDKPFLAVNHLAAHALSVRLSHGDGSGAVADEIIKDTNGAVADEIIKDGNGAVANEIMKDGNGAVADEIMKEVAGEITFPYLMLLVSGGHCQLVAVRGVQDYILYGETLDDSAGEVFDKAARMLDLPQPGGPNIERTAKNGHAATFPLPIPMQGSAGCDLSFSGLKTALKNKLHNKKTNNNEFKIADAAASLQQSIALSLKEKSAIAMERFKKDFPKDSSKQKKYHFCLVGGVAANQSIRTHLTTACNDNDFTLVAPPIKLCTDNAAMVAWAGVEMMRAGITHDLDFKVQPRWPLATLNAKTATLNAKTTNQKSTTPL